MLHVFQPFLVWEGPYVDTWSIAHFIVGFLLAYALHKVRYEKWHGFAVVIVLGIGWELVEQFILHTRVTETSTNSVTDVACAAVGYLIGYWAIHSPLSEYEKESAAALAIVIFCGVCLLRVLGA